jgi:hypothetical protein
MPRDPPVTKATLPLSEFVASSPTLIALLIAAIK